MTGDARRRCHEQSDQKEQPMTGIDLSTRDCLTEVDRSA
jgi:hypothetical protein